MSSFSKKGLLTLLQKLKSVLGQSDALKSRNRDEPCPPNEASSTLVFKFDLWSELKQSKGEDARPILDVREHDGLLAVFDGMGGSGGACYEVDGQVRTGASIASELARSCVREYFTNLKSDEESGGSNNSTAQIHELASGLTESLRATLKEEAVRLKIGRGRLEGKLVRVLPTTMACIYYRLSPKRDRVSCSVLWAGDSRAYRLTPRFGMQQLTSDDLKSRGDALQNLRDDSPLSNCISADSDFHIRHGMKEFDLPVTLLVATDGCFNYFATPFHFERAVLDSLTEALTEESWKQNLMSHLQGVAADDFSTAIVCLGWQGFDQMSEKYEGRRRQVMQEYIEPSDRVDIEVRELDGQYKARVEDREVLRQQLWRQYRGNYEKELLR